MSAGCCYVYMVLKSWIIRPLSPRIPRSIDLSAVNVAVNRHRYHRVMALSSAASCVGGGGSEKDEANPMKKSLPMHLSPRCTATSKRTRQRCRASAVTGWTVCRFHGARGGAPKGKRNGQYRHGLYTNEAIEERCALSSLLRASRKSLDALSGQDWLEHPPATQEHVAPQR